MRLMIIQFFAALIVLTNCVSALATDRLRIVTSFSILTNLVKEIGGDYVQIESLVEAGNDAHHFEPKPSDIKRLLNADLIIVNGLGFEPWLDRVIIKSKKASDLIIASKNIEPLPFEKADHVHHHSKKVNVDPHAWQDVSNVRIYVKNIAQALIKRDPDHEVAYQNNLNRYDAELIKLDLNIRDSLNLIPVERRKLVTTHDAFRYFERAYRLEMIAPLGVSAEAELSAKRMARIIRQIREQTIPAIFLETAIDPRLAEQLASETGVKIGGTLYADTLSKENDPAGTYIKMMEANLKTLTKALTH